MNNKLFSWGTAILFFMMVPLTSIAETIPIGVVNGHPSVFRWVKHLSKTFIPAVEKELEGTGVEVKWTESYGGSLAKVGGELEAVEEGLAEIGFIPSVFEPAKLPLQNIAYYTPFVSGNSMQTVGIIDKMHEKLPTLSKSWSRHNLEYLGAGLGLDDYHLFTKNPIRSLKDLKGLKIGAPGAAVNWLKGTGAVGVSGNLTTYYNSLKTGVFDGVIIFTTAALPAKLYEVAPYITKVSFGAPYAGGLAANRDWFYSQSKTVRQALHKAALAYQKAYYQDLDQSVTTFMKIMQSKGAKVFILPESERKKWAGQLPNMAKAWAASLDKQGMKGTEALKFYMKEQRRAGAIPLRNWDE